MISALKSLKFLRSRLKGEVHQAPVQDQIYPISQSVFRIQKAKVVVDLSQRTPPPQLGYNCCTPHNRFLQEGYTVVLALDTLFVYLMVTLILLLPACAQLYVFYINKKPQNFGQLILQFSFIALFKRHKVDFTYYVMVFSPFSLVFVLLLLIVLAILHSCTRSSHFSVANRCLVFKGQIPQIQRNKIKNVQSLTMLPCVQVLKKMRKIHEQHSICQKQLDCHGVAQLEQRYNTLKNQIQIQEYQPFLHVAQYWDENICSQVKRWNLEQGMVETCCQEWLCCCCTSQMPSLMLRHTPMPEQICYENLQSQNNLAKSIIFVFSLLVLMISFVVANVHLGIYDVPLKCPPNLPKENSTCYCLMRGFQSLAAEDCGKQLQNLLPQLFIGLISGLGNGLVVVVYSITTPYIIQLINYWFKKHLSQTNHFSLLSVNFMSLLLLPFLSSFPGVNVGSKLGVQIGQFFNFDVIVINSMGINWMRLYGLMFVGQSVILFIFSVFLIIKNLIKKQSAFLLHEINTATMAVNLAILTLPIYPTVSILSFLTVLICYAAGKHVVSSQCKVVYLIDSNLSLSVLTVIGSIIMSMLFYSEVNGRIFYNTEMWYIQNKSLGYFQFLFYFVVMAMSILTMIIYLVLSGLRFQIAPQSQDGQSLMIESYEVQKNVEYGPLFEIIQTLIANQN